MFLLKKVAPAFLAASLLAAPAQAQQVQALRPLADCSLLARDKSLTARFLGALDSRIHGYDRNLYEMTPAQREPFLREAIQKNPGHNPEFIRLMFEAPYRQYGELKSEGQRVKFLTEKLERFHKISSGDLNTLAASCG